MEESIINRRVLGPINDDQNMKRDKRNKEAERIFAAVWQSWLFSINPFVEIALGNFMYDLKHDIAGMT